MSLYAKLWTDILGDPKLMRAARKGAKHLVLLPWLFAFAKQAQDCGALTVGGEPAEALDIAALIPGVTAKQVSECLVALLELGVLFIRDDGAATLSAWERRSGDGKPSDSREAIRERVRRHRRKHRRGTPSDDGNADGNANGNAADVTRGNATEEEVEQEQEQEQEQETSSTTTRSKVRDRSPVPGVAEIAAALTTDADRNALNALLMRVPNPLAWLAEMRGCLEGMAGHVSVTHLQLGEALRDFEANGATANLRSFRRYLELAARAPEERANGRRPPASANAGAQAYANIMGGRR